MKNSTGYRDQGRQLLVPSYTEVSSIQYLACPAVIMNQFASISDLDVTEDNRKRKNEDEDGGGDSKRPRADDATDDDDACCAICMEDFSQENHMFCCLACGHPFGFRCIIDWISHNPTCPKCLAPAKKSDIRIIYHASKLAVKRPSKTETKMGDVHNDIWKDEALNSDVNDEVDAEADLVFDLEQRSGVETKPTPVFNLLPKEMNTFQLLQRRKLTTKSSYRAVFDHALDKTVVSCVIPTDTFSKYGVEICTGGGKCSYLPLHETDIVALSFQPETLNGVMLSGSADRKIKVSDIVSNFVIREYTSASPITTCTWDKFRTNYFYVGTNDGLVQQFDIRQRGCVNPHVVSFNQCITHVESWNADICGDSVRGLLIANAQDLIFHEQLDDQKYTDHHILDLSERLLSLNLHSSGSFLASTRPSNTNRKYLHKMNKLHMCYTPEGERSLYCTEESSFPVSINVTNPMVLPNCRNILISQPDREESLMAVVSNPSEDSVDVFDETHHIQRLPCFNKALEIKQVGYDTIGVLTSQEYMVYGWEWSD